MMDGGCPGRAERPPATCALDGLAVVVDRSPPGAVSAGSNHLSRCGRAPAARARWPTIATPRCGGDGEGTGTSRGRGGSRAEHRQGRSRPGARSGHGDRRGHRRSAVRPDPRPARPPVTAGREWFPRRRRGRGADRSWLQQQEDRAEARHHARHGETSRRGGPARARALGRAGIAALVATEAARREPLRRTAEGSIASERRRRIVWHRRSNNRNGASCRNLGSKTAIAAFGSARGAKLSRRAWRQRMSTRSPSGSRPG